MKILESGREQRGWSQESTCTGAGNGYGGCRAKLLVEQGDLFKTSSSCYDGSSETYITFQCGCCGVRTGIPNSKVPSYVLSTVLQAGAWEEKQPKKVRQIVFASSDLEIIKGFGEIFFSAHIVGVVSPDRDVRKVVPHADAYANACYNDGSTGTIITVNTVEHGQFTAEECDFPTAAKAVRRQMQEAGLL